jgi:microcystin-dependent protein
MLTTTRRAISYPNTTRTDAPDIPLHIQNLANILDLDTPFYTGTDAAKPGTGTVVQGSFYWATDTAILYINTGTWTALASKGSPALTGTPTAPTAAVTDSSTTIATTAFVRSILPPGIIVPYGGTTAPAGWLMCDGTAQSRVTYSALFALIGTTYGAGDGSTTFNLPNLQGRVPVGKNTATFSVLGQTGGEETHVIVTGEMPIHTHAFTGNALAGHTHTVTMNAMATHSHTFTGSALPTHTHVFTGTALGTHSHTFTGSALAAHTHTFAGSALGGHTHSVSATVGDHHHYLTMNHPNDAMITFSAHARDGGTTAVVDIGGIGGATGASNVPVYSGFVDFSDSSDQPCTGSTNSVSAGTPAGTNSSVSAGTPAGTLSSDSAGTPAGTNASISAGTPAGTLSSDSAGTPTGSLSTDSAGTPSGTNANAGSGTAHNNIQPYLVTNYIVKF